MTEHELNVFCSKHEAERYSIGTYNSYIFCNGTYTAGLQLTKERGGKTPLISYKVVYEGLSEARCNEVMDQLDEYLAKRRKRQGEEEGVRELINAIYLTSRN